jgi:hypothetical protein
VHAKQHTVLLRLAYLDFNAAFVNEHAALLGVVAGGTGDGCGISSCAWARFWRLLLLLLSLLVVLLLEGEAFASVLLLPKPNNLTSYASSAAAACYCCYCCCCCCCRRARHLPLPLRWTRTRRWCTSSLQRAPPRR